MRGADPAMSAPAVLITGAGGFVCAEFALAFADAGWSVIALDREFDPLSAERLAGVERIAGPLPQVFEALGDRPIDAVIHGAAITAPPDALGMSRADHLAANIEPLTATLAMARQCRVRTFLFLSSMGVFAPEDGPAPAGLVTEDAIPTADFSYCVAKRTGEMITTAAREPGFQTLSLRLGNICGPGERARASRPYVSRLRGMTLDAEAGGGIAVSTPEALRDWAWLPDLANGIPRLVRDGLGEAPVLHAGTPPAIKDLDLASAIAARRPGLAIKTARPPHEHVRPPMGSRLQSPFSSIEWTSVEAILDRLVPAEVAG